MKKHLHQNPNQFIPLACYACGLFLLLALHLAGFVGNQIARANGALTTQTLTLEDFDLLMIENQNGTLYTTGEDPQMLLKDPSRKADSLQINFTFSKPPMALLAFYAKPGQGHSVRRMVYPNENGVFLFPPFGAQILRIDPGTVAGNTIQVHSILLNPPRAWHTFFIPTAGEWALLLLLPGFAASALLLLQQGKSFLRARKAVKPK